MSIFDTYFKKIRLAIQLFRYAYSGYKWQIVLITILGFVGGLTGGLGVGMLIPLFSLVTKQNDTANTLQIPNTFQHFLRQFFAFFDLKISLHLVLGLMIALFILKALVSILINYISERVAAQYLKDVGSSLFKKTLTANWPFLINQKVGYLDRMIASDATSAAAILQTSSEMMLRLTALLTYTLLALKISTPITLWSLLFGTIIVLVFKPFFYKLRRLSLTVGNTGKDLSHHINESVIGIKTVKAFGVEDAIAEKGSGFFETLKKVQIRIGVISRAQGYLFEPASLIFISVLFAYSTRIPGFDIASFAVIIYLIQKMFGFIQGVQGKIDDINSAYPRLKTMLAYQKDLENNQESASGTKPFKFDNSLEIKNVSFTYPNTENNILQNINFSVKRGEMIGIIGPSGAGKTTLVDLLLRLLEPQDGTIEIDDMEVSAISLNSWHQKVGYVPQDVFLLHDTVEANIRFYDGAISQKRVEEAAKLANIYDFIQELPDKFQTSVGERGVKLSGGQKQRISLARVLAKEPSLLILDEATSSLDNESEAMIQKAINNLKGKVTVIVIAHRLTTVMNADRLIVLNKGTIAETGAPDELINNANSYLYKSHHAVNN